MSRPALGHTEIVSSLYLEWTTIKKATNCDPVLLRGTVAVEARSIPGSSLFISPAWHIAEPTWTAV
jgi:hypothetical protein